MGGRLSRKKRGYNVNDPKEGKTTAESTQDPEVKDEPENPDASKEQVKKPEVELPEEKPETEAPKAASDAAKPADLATPDVKTEEKATVDVPATDPVQALDVSASVPATDVQVLDVPATDVVQASDVQASVPATDPVQVSDVPATDVVQASDVQASVPAINLVKATEQSPEPVEHHLVTETVESSSTPDTGSSADTPDVPELSEGKTQTVLAVCEETQGKPVLDKEMGMTSEDPSNETSNLGDHVTTEIMKVEQLENSHLIPEDQDESEVPEVIENQDNVSPQSTLKEVESALQETSSESGVEVPPKEIEIPRLPITVETPIDIVLKNEIASCEKHVAGPDTQDEIQEKIVSETIRPTDQMVADVKIEPTEHSVKNSDHVQEDSDKVLADQSLAEGSGNLSVDTLRETSVTDVVPVESKDAMAECPPETVSTLSAAEVVTAESTPETKSNTVMETRCEQTPELISHQDGVKTPLLETSSEAIPDIKVTVYTEGLQEQIETGTEPTKGSTGDESLPESFVSDSEAHPPKLDSTVEDSTVPGTASALTFGEPSPIDVIKTEETSYMKTENGFSVDEQSQNESALKSEGDKLPDDSVLNGTPVDNGDQSKKSQVEVNSQSETIKAEENIQDSISDSAVGSKSIEQVNTDPPAMESGCLKLDNQTLDSGL